MAKKFSIIIPVLNEADIIDKTLNHVEVLDRREECEVIVVDGNPDGNTIGAAAHYRMRGIKSSMGRAIQMNRGAEAATGEVLIFLHADTRLPRTALSLIDQAITPQTVGGAFDLRIDTRRPILKAISLIASLRSRLTRIPYGDQAIFIRRDYFNRIKRYPEIPLMEDVAIMRRIKKAGGRICFIREPVITSARRWEREGILYTTLRNWFLLLGYCLGVAPDRLARYYGKEKGGGEISTLSYRVSEIPRNRGR